MDRLVVARALHVLAVVVWIGGLTMVTTVLLPAIRRGDLGADRLEAFRAIEHRFLWQARTAVVIVGLTGFYMAASLDLWERFRSAQFWWMHAMVGFWLLFMVILFLAEPFILRRHLQRWVATQPARALAWFHRAHWLLLALALATVFGAVAGSWGWSVF